MKTSRKPKTRPKLKPREKLIEVASRRFYQVGLRATGIDLIIAEAGVAKMSFYRHFPSKNHLIAEYLRLQHEKWMARIQAGLQNRREPHSSGIEIMAEIMRAWFDEPDFRGCPFINAQAEVLPEDERVREMIQWHQRELEFFLTDLLVEWGYASPRSAAEVVLVILHGSIVQAQSSGNAVSAGEACGSLLRRFSRSARRLEDMDEAETNQQLLLAL